MKSETKIECLVCGNLLDNLEYDMKATGERVEVHPMNGLHFRTYGHYGSVVFDPMDGSYLDIAICDHCVVKNISRVRGSGLEQLKEELKYFETTKEK